ncbi:epoxide hydrolase family protein [Nocardia pseudobrasiliensis]|uniref:Pimeloyl-ACP methyl ester carboxylesterase n=1 Tax=Nocardia pseudobrasiliensis TaxID=45979 RepID=A0A370I5J3_9NOCA|nr:epoxide hydrolase family protein [Nocardia pseudobrasiliensis]RDI65900.1 pimeloyl-ACP methyl ester carboxylesterase [Nocardia pseudobrasiliensis]
MSDIRPFRIEVSQADLDDLNYRLAHTRFAAELPAECVAGKVDLGIPVPAGWEYGVPQSFVRPMLERWRDEFDWRAVEEKLNAYPHFVTEIDGQTIHFVHVRSANPEATPLMLTHGWPSSFVEGLKLVDRLTDQFHLVIPSYPGFAFSGPTQDIGWTPERMAAALVELMRRLGYERYGVHGNDGGAIISPEMGRLAPENVIGVHVTQIFSFPKGEPGEFDGLSEQDLAFIQFGQKFLEHSIHDFSQRAQPQTIAQGLSDSPSGQLTWNAQLMGTLDPDDFLTNVAIYWFTNTSASSARFYYENAHGTHASTPTTVPIGLASFGYDYKPPRKFADRDHANIIQWNEYPEGGHWSAYEVPDLLATDIREFFAKLV